MKEKLILVAAIISSGLMTFSAAAADGPSDDTRGGSSMRAPKVAKWNVRVEVLMVEIPQEKALALLPELHSPDKIEGAFTRILAAIEHKEAVLTGYPVVYTLDGERAVSETIVEQRYPTEFDPPQNAQLAGVPATPEATAITDNAIPTAFETRNLGVTLEVEPYVIEKGRSIRLSLLPQRVGLIGFDSYDSVKDKHGRIMKIDQPKFFTTKSDAKLVLRNGQRSLLGVHKLAQPDNHIALFIVQAIATPTKYFTPRGAGKGSSR